MCSTDSAILILFAVLVFGCDSAEEGNGDTFLGKYRVAEFTAPDETDGQRDILQYGVDLELTLAREHKIKDGLFVEPCWPARECSPIAERTTTFEGSYRVNGDTLVLQLDQKIDALPQEASWHFDSGRLQYRSRGWPPEPEVTLVRK